MYNQRQCSVYKSNKIIIIISQMGYQTNTADIKARVKKIRFNNISQFFRSTKTPNNMGKATLGTVTKY